MGDRDDDDDDDAVAPARKASLTLFPETPKSTVTQPGGFHLRQLWA